MLDFSSTDLEFDFLRLCSSPTNDQTRIRDLIARGLDWNKLLTLAAAHGVRPLLAESLTPMNRGQVPDTIRVALKTFQARNAFRNMFLAGELGRVSLELRSENIKFAALKGVLIAATLYGDLSRREVADIDIIVQQSQMQRAETILRRLGYTARYEPEAYRRAFLTYQRQYAFELPGTPASIDLHWNFAPKFTPFPLAPEQIWDRLVDVQLAGSPIPTLSPEHLVLFLAGHGTKEKWLRLIWLSDFARCTLRFPDLNWIELHRTARLSGSARSLFLAAFLTGKLLDLPPPSIVAQDRTLYIRPPRHAVRAMRNICRPNRTSEFREFLNGLDAADNWWDRVMPILALMVTRTVGDHEAIPLPRLLWRVYHLTRPLRLTYKGLKSLLSGLRMN